MDRNNGIVGGLIRAWVLGGALLVPMSGCIVSESSCAEGEKFVDEDIQRCTCAEGYILDEVAEACVACGENETSKANQCVCMDGYVRDDSSGNCREVVAGEAMFGGACDSDAACVDPYGYCADATGDGYCTSSACTDNSDCEDVWTCVEESGSSYCKRPPSGLGETCASQADCAGFEATYCETFQAKTCQLVGCAEGNTTCPGDWVCCDLRGALGVSMCVTPDVLDANGECPAGAGKPVTP